MSRDDKYRIVTSTFRGVSPSSSAFFIDRPTVAGLERDRISIPFSLVHGGDAIRLEREQSGKEVTFRLFEWKAEELGLS